MSDDNEKTEQSHSDSEKEQLRDVARALDEATVKSHRARIKESKQLKNEGQPPSDAPSPLDSALPPPDKTHTGHQTKMMKQITAFGRGFREGVSSEKKAKAQRTKWPSIGVLVFMVVWVLFVVSRIGINRFSFFDVMLSVCTCMGWFSLSKTLARRQSFLLRGIGYFLFFICISVIWNAIEMFGSDTIEGRPYSSAVVWLIGLLFFAAVIFIGACYLVFQRPDPTSEQVAPAPAPEQKEIVEEVEGGRPCVSCGKRIASVKICPFCGWTQPRGFYDPAA